MKTVQFNIRISDIQSFRGNQGKKNVVMFVEQTVRADNSLEITAGKVTADCSCPGFIILHFLLEFLELCTVFFTIIWAIWFLLRDQKWTINLIMLDDLVGMECVILFVWFIWSASWNNVLKIVGIYIYELVCINFLDISCKYWNKFRHPKIQWVSYTTSYPL